MKPAKLYSYFEDLAEKMDIKLISGKGDFQGGPCKVNLETVIVVNSRKPIEQQLRVLAHAFGSMEISSTYLIPALRNYIEDTQTELFIE